MSLLQDPKKVLEQIEWYVQNKELEKFSGAFIMSAGNLCRQLVEQILFIISFYGELPKEKYIKNDDKIKTPFEIIKSLKEIDSQDNTTYIDKAIRRGKRIEKFAVKLSNFDNWRKLFNEPSHFRNPIRTKHYGEDDITKFINMMKEIIDDKDCHLLTAAINEMKSGGKIKATLSNDDDNTPAISMEIILTPKDIIVENKSLSIKYNKIKYFVVPDDKEIPYKIIKEPILIQHSKEIMLEYRVFNKHRKPIDLTNFQTTLNGICSTKEDCIELKKHLKKYGVFVKIDNIPNIEIYIN